MEHSDIVNADSLHPDVITGATRTGAGEGAVAGGVEPGGHLLLAPAGGVLDRRLELLLV